MSITIGDAILYLAASDKQLQSDLKSAERKAESWVSAVSNVVQTGMGTAIGFISRDLVGATVRGFQTIASEALASVGSYERLTLSLESLVARELMRGQVTKQSSQIVQHLTDAEKAKLDELIAKQQIADANVLQLQAAFDAEHKKVIENGGQWSAALTELEGRITLAKISAGQYTTEIDRLKSKDGELATITREVITGQLSQAEAMAQAGPKAKELVQWITKLAVLSPFKQEEVAGAFRMAMAYGFTSDEAKRLTTAMINFASGSGASGEVMDRIALALGQIKAKGKLAGQEVLQLVNAGLPVTDILARAFGKTTAEIEQMRSQGLIKADDAIKAIIETLEKDFAGAAEKQATSWAGLVSTLQDIKEVGLREFFTGTFKAIQPYVQKFVDAFTEGDLLDKIRAIGDALGEKVGAAMQWLNDNAVPMWNELVKWAKYFFWAVEDGQAPLEVLKKIIWALLPPDLKVRLQEFGDLLKPITDAAGNLFTALANNDPEAFFASLDELGKGIGGFLSRYGGDIFGALFEPGYFAKLIASVVWPEAEAALDQLSADFKTWVESKAPEVGNTFNSWGTAATNWLVSKVPDALQNNESFWLAVREWVSGKVVDLAAGFFEWGTQGVKWIGERTPEALGNLGAFLGSLLAWIITDGVPNLILGTQELSKALVDWVVNDAIPNIWPKLYEFSLAIYAFFTDSLIPGLIEFGQKFIEGLVTGIVNRQPAMISKWGEIYSNIRTTVEGWKNGLMILGEGIVDNILIGITMKIGQVISTVKKMVRDALAAAGEALGETNPFAGGGKGSVEVSPEKRHSGGPIEAGKPYIVKKDEALIFPPMDGFVLPEIPNLASALSPVTGGGRGGQSGPTTVNLLIDGTLVGQLTLDGALQELGNRGLQVTPVS